MSLTKDQAREETLPMAIAYARPQIVSRSSGRSAVACAAYRAGEKLYDERYGKTQDYERKSGVIAQGILTPNNAPEWMHDQEKLWNAVERREDRSTRPDQAQLAREMVIALPHELDNQGREYLVKNILKEAAIRKGMIADYAIHAPDKEGDTRNYHAHVLLTMREIDPTDPDGLGKKARDWNSKQELKAFKSIIERETNRMLERHGIKERVSFTLETGHEAQQHMGQAATQLERQGVQTHVGEANRERQQRNQTLAQARHALGAVSHNLSQGQAMPAEPAKNAPEGHVAPVAEVGRGIGKGAGAMANMVGQVAEKAIGGIASLFEGLFGAATPGTTTPQIPSPDRTT